MASKFSKFIRKKLGAESLNRRLRAHRIRIEDNLRKQASHQAGLQFHVNETLQSLKENKFGRVALVTPMPPSDTGIAFFSLRMAIENPDDIDIYTTYESAEDYFDQKDLFPNIRIYPVELLGFMSRQANYKSVVFSFGNSHHNIFVIDKLHKFSKLGLAAKIIAEVHDPCSLNIASRFWTLRGKLDCFSDVYEDRLKETVGRTELELIERNIFGVKAALHGANVDEILVHSFRAKEMIVDDYGKDKTPHIKVGFHPIFRGDYSNDLDSSKYGISVGSFGIPGTNKFLNEKIEAFVKLKRVGLVDNAIFAGYHASQIVRKLYGAIPKEITVIEDPSDKELAHYMANITVAVQLRRANLGESSGVVPQLLGHRKNIICNKIGAFSEYGDVVKYLEKEITAETIFEAVCDVLKNEKCNSKNISNFIELHRSQNLLKLIDS